MDGQNIHCILQDIVPMGPLPCLQLENLKKRKAGQGYHSFHRDPKSVKQPFWNTGPYQILFEKILTLQIFKTCKVS